MKRRRQDGTYAQLLVDGVYSSAEQVVKLVERDISDIETTANLRDSALSLTSDALQYYFSQGDGAVLFLDTDTIVLECSGFERLARSAMKNASRPPHSLPSPVSSSPSSPSSGTAPLHFADETALDVAGGGGTSGSGRDSLKLDERGRDKAKEVIDISSVLGRPYISCIHPEDTAAIEEAITSLQLGNLVCSSVHARRLTSRGWLCLSLSFLLMVDDDRRTAGCLVLERPAEKQVDVSNSTTSHRIAR